MILCGRAGEGGEKGGTARSIGAHISACHPLRRHYTGCGSRRKVRRIRRVIINIPSIITSPFHSVSDKRNPAWQADSKNITVNADGTKKN